MSRQDIQPELHTPEQQLLRQLQALNRIGRIATEELELRPMLQRIVDALHAQFGWTFIACASVDPILDSFVCEALHSDIQTEIAVGYTRKMGSGVVGEVAQTGRTLDIPDTRLHANFIETLGATRSELCVPIKHQGKVLAVLNVESQQVNAFDGQRVLLETVADQIAGAVRLSSTLAETLRLNRELRDANATLYRLSQVDGLTGLANRRQFDLWLDEVWTSSHRDRQPLSVALIDVDHFKAYNDHYGHLVGDDGLRRVAQLLTGACQWPGARIARYGGEEFVLLFPNCTQEAAHHAVNLLCQRVANEGIEHCGSPIGVLSISAGVAGTAPDAAGSAQILLNAADRALYIAKHQGRNRVVLAHTES